MDNHQRDSIQNLESTVNNILLFFSVRPALIEKARTGYHLYYYSHVNLNLWKECFDNLRQGSISIELYGYFSKFRLPFSHKYECVEFNPDAEYIEHIYTPEPVEFKFVPTFLRQFHSIRSDIDLDYSAGNRVNTIRTKIIPYLVLHPVSSYEEFKDFILSHNCGSIDYDSWSEDKIDKDIQQWFKFYSKLKLNRNLVTSEFKSNKRLLNPIQIRQINKCADKLSSIISLPKKYNKRETLVNLLSELVGYELYCQVNPKYVNTIPVNKELREELEIGYEIPRPFLLRFSKEYDIPVYLILRLYTYLISINFLKLIYFSKGYSYLKNRFVTCARRLESIVKSIEEYLIERVRATSGVELNNYICVAFPSSIYVESS